MSRRRVTSYSHSPLLVDHANTIQEFRDTINGLDSKTVLVNMDYQSVPVEMLLRWIKESWNEITTCEHIELV